MISNGCCMLGPVGNFNMVTVAILVQIDRRRKCHSGAGSFRQLKLLT